MRNKVNLLTRNEIRRIAMSYATSADELSATYYAEQHQITESVFYRCLEKAVEESIVDLKTAELIAAKSGRNAARHAGDGARVNSNKHYQRYIDARESFRFAAPERKHFVKKYANSEKGFISFCNDECVAQFIMVDALKTAIVKEEVDTATVEKLYQKSVKFHGKKKADSLYDRLKTERRAHRDARLQDERVKRKERKERKRAELEAKRREEHQSFIQLTFDDFSIPGELEEQKESLGLPRKTDES